MKLNRKMDKIAVTAVTGALLMGIITSVMIGAVSYAFYAMPPPDNSLKQLFCTEDEYNIRFDSVSSGMEYKDIKIGYIDTDGTPIEYTAKAGTVLAGDIIHIPLGSRKVTIITEDGSQLLYSHDFDLKNYPPNSPRIRYPNNCPDVPIDPELSVKVVDRDDDSMKVSFYDASNEEIIEVYENVPSGATVKVIWTGLQYNTLYSWYVIANDGEFSTKSPTVQFETETEPEDPMDEWPMYRHDPHHSGFSTSEAPNTNNTLWIHPLGGTFIESSPTFYDDKIYIGSFDSKIYCLDSTDGSEIWTYTTGGNIRSSPAIADGKVFFGSNDDKIYCFDADPFDDLVDEGFNDPDDVSYDLIWTYITGSNVQSSPTIVEDRVYIGSNDKKIYCLNAENGALIWQNQTGGNIMSSPAVVDNNIYIGSNDGRVYCFDADNGEEQWNKKIGGLVPSSPTIANGRLYVGSSWDKIYCLDTLDGTVIWAHPTEDFVYSSPAIYNNYVYIGSNDGKIYCLDAQGNGDGTTNEIWTYHTTDDGIWSSPAIADDKVYIGSGDGKVHCLDAIGNGDGTTNKIWDYLTGDIICYSSPAIADGKVFISSRDNNVYCFGDGENQPPNIPSDPSPLDGTTNIAIASILSWTGGDPGPDDTVTYDVYFGINPALDTGDLVSDDQSGITYDPGVLNYDTNYFWKIVAKDNHGATREGPVWSFTTINQFNFGDAEIFNNAGIAYADVAALDDTHIVIAYSDIENSKRGTVVLGTIIGNSISFTCSPTIFNDDITSNIAITVLDPERVVIAYQDEGNSKYGTAIVGSKQDPGDGTYYIAFNGPEAVFNNAETLDIDISTITDERVLISYVDRGNGDSGTARVGYISLCTIAFDGIGYPEVFDSKPVDSISSTILHEQSIVIVYRIHGSSYVYKVVVGEFIDDYTPIFGNPTSLESCAQESDISITKLNEMNQVAISYKVVIDDETKPGYIKLGTISGLTISFGSPIEFEGKVEVPNTSIITMDNSNVVVVYGKVNAGNVNGDSVDFESSPAVSYGYDGSSWANSATALDNNHFVIIFAEGNVYQAVVGEIIGY